MFNRLLRHSKTLISRENNSILSAALVIMGATLISAFLGVVRTRLLISYFFADKGLVDVFWAAFRLPDMVFQIFIVGALSSAFIPVFTKYHEKEGEKEASQIASTMINYVVGIMCILVVGIIIWAKPLSHLIAGGFNDSQIELMTLLTRVMAVAQILFGFSSFLTGIIQSQKRFLIPAISPILYNVGIIIGTILFSKQFGIVGPALGVVLGAILHLLAQIPLSRALGFRYSFNFRPHKAVSEMGRLMLPRVLTLSLSQIEATAIIAFSSWLSAGSVTIMAIAQQLAGVPVRLIGVPIGQASLPFFSKESAKNNLGSLAGMVNDTILQMLYLALPASILILILRIPLVRLAYGADSFPWAETVMTGKLVALLALSIAARSLTHVVIRVFYALHDTFTPLIISALSTVINVGLSYYLLFIIQTGVIGMAAAITTASILETIILTAFLYNIAHFPIRTTLIPFGRMLLASTIMGFSLWGPLRLLDRLIFDTTRTIPLILLTLVVTIIGLSVYIGLSYLLKIRELEIFFGIVKKVGDWKKALTASGESLESQESSV
ncbi:MAG: murein biosynthesis integral membrane protein MurJ [bacterium]